jgi:hypothetical protein
VSEQRAVNWIILLGLCCLAVVVCGIVRVGAFGYSSVCVKCGLTRHTTEWQIPRLRVPVYRRSRQIDTPVRQVLSTSGLVPQHAHEWRFCSGSGNGVRCALGRGRHIPSTVSSREVALLIQSLRKHGQSEFCDSVLRHLFDDNTTTAVRILAYSLPTNGFADRSDAAEWAAEHRPGFEEDVRVYQRR